MTPPATRARGSTRDRLLAAAAAVVRREGPRGLTLDAVAAEAGVSKGGLLYHFPTKRDLVRGLLADWMDGFEADVERNAEDDVAGGWTRAYVRESDMTRAAPAERDAEFSLLAMLIDAPEELDPLRERYLMWQERIDADGIDQVDAMLARLAADGLWYADLLDLAPPTGRRRAELLERIQALAKPG